MPPDHAAARSLAPVAFVGRRLFEAAELYALSPHGVEMLRSQSRYGSPELDWQGGYAPLMELSHELLTRVAGQTPSEELAGRFAVHVLIELPDTGFVIDADQIEGWIAYASEPWEWSAPAPDVRHAPAGVFVIVVVLLALVLVTLAVIPTESL
jgi:hypothetical protein